MNKTRMMRGISLVEVVIASAIVTVGILALIASYMVYMKFALQNGGNVQTAYLLEEGAEVMTHFRNQSWANYIEPLSTTTTYYLVYNGTAWATTTEPQVIDGVFMRTITLKDVFRDNAGAIVTAGGVFDSNTRQITVSVGEMRGTTTSTTTLETYLANINND